MRWEKHARRELIDVAREREKYEGEHPGGGVFFAYGMLTQKFMELARYMDRVEDDLRAAADLRTRRGFLAPRRKGARK